MGGRCAPNLTGKRYGRLVVLERDRSDVYSAPYWLCRCDCGNVKSIRGTNLINGLTTSCGCRKHERRSEDLTGKRFGRLYVLGFDHTDSRGRSYWLCKCDCGNVSVPSRSALLGGLTASCGCGSREGMKPVNLTGQRFGRLYVLGLDHKNAKSGSYWLCECDCGGTALFRTQELLSGRTTSCGCLDGRTIHMGSKSYDSLYNIWCGMRQRCGNTSSPVYHRYGGRGIFVCDEWHEFENFRDWAFDNGYQPGLTIDRIDNDDGYYPENCRWVGYVEQANNRRSSHYVTYNGATHTVAEWARLLNINYTNLLRHINNGDMRDFEEYFGTED